MAGATRLHKRTIIPDYRRPQALLVPHYHSTITATLEAIAAQASRHVGVLLLSRDPESTRAFVETRPNPELFHILTAPFDTPWLRDRSPVAVKQDEQIHWVLPQLKTPERPLDEQLFRNITRKPIESTTLGLPHGNLIAGPRGCAVVMLEKEQDSPPRGQLDELAPLLGVSRWIIAPGFRREMSGHADIHVRFLRPKLAAVAWHQDDREDQECIERLEVQLRATLKDIEILRLPLRSEDNHYASPLNWIQLGKHLLVPRYPISPPSDIKLIRERLKTTGFQLEFIYSPTLEYAGSLHCLTASIYL